ncbi:hypothetical protein GCM10023350_23050 [Nocardioides endophyticus]|uniref:Ferredoxin n=1 Tax=Nocardioides endophyticus TaxID=1353775 RepID=A0ABP8YS94_9ACTN
MKISLDRSLCNGYGNCVIEAPELFDLDESGIGVVLQEEPDDSMLTLAEAAARICPVIAITVTA